MVAEARKPADRPAFILLESTIAKGAPHAAGTAEAHGAPLGAEEVKAAKRALGVPEDAAVPRRARGPRVLRREEASRGAGAARSGRRAFDAWSRRTPRSRRNGGTRFAGGAADLSAVAFPAFKVGEALATRSASGKVLNAVAKAVPSLVGGSADLAPVQQHVPQGHRRFQPVEPVGPQLPLRGARARHGRGRERHGLPRRPPAVLRDVHGLLRLHARRRCAWPRSRSSPSIYVFTHDSIFVGEDGPTHEPVEHLAALRAIPNLQVLRPADAEETEAAWRMALGAHGRPDRARADAAQT